MRDIPDDEPTEKQTMTVPEAAHILGVPKRTLYYYAANGGVPVVRLGRRVLMLKETVDRLLKSGRLIDSIEEHPLW